ncbi:hypothetical protein OESDEN_15983 [Oesophagostomum dentatum]|uniref:Uncharacterized protein n=1 Tax=Oesophagostomum dentatum TaxID=61180 RepID=A0A0B1SK91_OESDE|nr:hypothetical protein OESDEN_15983 [Oesophagostomum dentatum]
MEILYTDEETNMTGLPEWNPPEPVDDTAYIALLTSLGLLLISLVIPMAIVLLFRGYKRSVRAKEDQKPVTEDLSQLDHIFDPDGEYRESKFDGMLNEDAADDVEFPSQSIQAEIAVEKKKSKEDMTTKRNAATQTDPLYVYGTDVSLSVLDGMKKTRMICFSTL